MTTVPGGAVVAVVRIELPVAAHALPLITVLEVGRDGDRPVGSATTAEGLCRILGTWLADAVGPAPGAAGG